MSGEAIKDIISTVVFLLPVLTLVWKGAKITARMEGLEDKVKENEEGARKNFSLIQDQMRTERVATNASIGSIMSTLTEIQKSLVRVETKLDIEEEKRK